MDDTDTHQLRELRRRGRLEEARAMVRALLDTNPTDPWEVLLIATEVYAASGDDEAANRLLALCWRRALSRDRQASTLHAAGQRDVRAGSLDAGASKLALALTMRRGFAEPAAVADTERSLSRVRAQIGMDVIVLAGGRGTRLAGSDKPGQPLGGWPLLDHVLLAAAGASQRIVVGPARQALTEPVFCREDPAGSGPLAAIAAGVARIGQPLVAVLAADLPFIGGALAPLRDALGGSDAAVLIDPSGRTNYLAAVWRADALQAAIRGIGELTNRRVQALYADATVSYVPDFDAWGADCDTLEDLAIAAERLSDNATPENATPATGNGTSERSAKHRSPAQLSVTPLAWPRLELFAPS